MRGKLLTHYRYTASWFDEFLITCVLAGSFSLLTLVVGKTRPGGVFPTLLTLALLIKLGTGVRSKIFAGTQTVEQNWMVNDYRIGYIRDQGFSGGALLKYRLENYTFFHLFIRYVDNTFVEEAAAEECRVAFPSSRMTFNKCTGQLTKAIR